MVDYFPVKATPGTARKVCAGCCCAYPGCIDSMARTVTTSPTGRVLNIRNCLITVTRSILIPSPNPSLKSLLLTDFMSEPHKFSDQVLNFD